ncbi:hypothetical protein ACWE42_14650 [Sutcliffiella cohnii]
MSKESKVLENVSTVFYTVHINDEVAVIDFTGISATVGSVENRYLKKLQTIKDARVAALFVNGKIKKHTKHKIVTEEIEEVEFDGNCKN